MDLSKAFNVIPHGLFLAKLHVYGCDTNVLKLMYSYRNDRKQRTKIGSARSEWKTLMPQSQCAESTAELGRIDHSCLVGGSFLVILAMTMTMKINSNSVIFHKKTV